MLMDEKNDFFLTHHWVHRSILGHEHVGCDEKCIKNDCWLNKHRMNVPT